MVATVLPSADGEWCGGTTLLKRAHDDIASTHRRSIWNWARIGGLTMAMAPSQFPLQRWRNDRPLKVRAWEFRTGPRRRLISALEYNAWGLGLAACRSSLARCPTAAAAIHPFIQIATAYAPLLHKKHLVSDLDSSPPTLANFSAQARIRHREA